jgi:hypothetical protein
MNLLERIADLKRRAAEQQRRQDGLDEARRLQPLLNEAKALSQGLGTEVTHLHLLRGQGLPLQADLAGADAGAALTTLDRLRQRFAEQRTADRLTRGQDWTRFKERTETARSKAATTLNQAWRDFVTSAYSGDKPADLERSLAPTDLNKERLSRYRAAHEELLRLANRRPTGREDFDRVRDLARQLKELHQGFDFSVPEAVKQFLQAIAKGGADLDLLTDEVRDWLQQQGSTGRYQIVAKRSAP